MIYLDAKILILALAAIIGLWLIMRHGKKAAPPFIVAGFIALLWTSYYRYEYEGSNFFLLDRINIYPLLLWTVGLAGLHLTSYTLSSGRYRLILGTIGYLAGLLAVEAIGYHLLNIRLASHYTSLLNLGVIHAPTIMKIFYIFAGPCFLLLFDYLDYKQRHLHRYVLGRLRSA